MKEKYFLVIGNQYAECASAEEIIMAFRSMMEDCYDIPDATELIVNLLIYGCDHVEWNEVSLQRGEKPKVAEDYGFVDEDEIQEELESYTGRGFNFKKIEES